MHSPVRRKKPAFAMASADWSQIHADILFSILKSLPLVDYLRFAAVCSSWRSAAKDRGSFPATQPPWLMLRDTRNRTTRFHSISHHETYTIHLPVDDFHDRFIIGSSRGWLVTICRNYDIDLLNPVTGAQIHLPPFIKISGGRKFFLRFQKIIVVPPPGPAGSSSLAHGFTVVALQRSALAVVRAGDERWTRLETTTDMGFCDVICHDGLVYAVTYDGRVASWDLSGPISIKMMLPSLIRYGPFKQLYLVESSGDLLLVSRCLKRVIWTLKVHINIFKLDCGRREWVTVESLGDRSLFLGLNESLSLSTLGFPLLESNCIYFTDNRIEDLIFCSQEHRDMVLYHLEDKRVEPYDFDDKQLTWPTPLWFTPNFDAIKRIQNSQ